MKLKHVVEQAKLRGSEWKALRHGRETAFKHHEESSAVGGGWMPDKISHADMKYV